MDFEKFWENKRKEAREQREKEKALALKGKNRHGNISCACCGGYDITLHVGYDGCDWESEKGEGSGYKYSVLLVCEDCGRAYPVCRLKDDVNYSDIRGITE